MGSKPGSAHREIATESLPDLRPEPAGLDAPGPGREDGADDARVCQRIVARHARTFFMASRLLPHSKRRAAFAVYATCRTADDIVDANPRGSNAIDALHRFRNDALQALVRRSEQPVLRELARAWHTFDVPDEPLRELFDTLELDLQDVAYRTWNEVEPYCQGVAGSVGEMCSAIFGIAGDVRRTDVVSNARTLGVAMQLTNILRDVGEDARRGRCYLPTEELERHGLSRGSLVGGQLRSDSDEWRGFMRFQVDRARALYRQALPAIRLLQLDAQRCALACATGYEKILDAIENADFDTLSRRVSASRLTLLAVAWRSWRGDIPLAPRTQIVNSGQAPR